MTLQTDLETAVADVRADSVKLKKIVNGPASGAGSTVTTDSGDVKTVAKAVADLEARFVVSDVLSRSTAARDAAQAAQKAAETARDEAKAVSIDADKLDGHDAGYFATAQALAQVLDDIKKTLVPVGTIIVSASKTAPDGYMLCNGAAISRTAYADLFTAIGTAFGAGDGSKTFNVPDLRGEFPRGWDNGRGADGGRVFGSSQNDAFQGHYHAYNLEHYPYGDHNYPTLLEGALVPTVSTKGVAIKHPISDGQNGTPRIGPETRPRNVALSFFIKY